MRCAMAINKHIQNGGEFFVGEHNEKPKEKKEKPKMKVDDPKQYIKT